MKSKQNYSRQGLQNPTTILREITVISLLVLTAGCSTFRTSPAPEPPPPVSEPEVVAEISGVATNEPVAAPEIVEQPRALQLEAIGVGFLEPTKPIDETPEPKAPDFVEADGYGFPSPNAMNPAQKMHTATEAAQYRALANLAEKYAGVDVSREAQTIDMAFAREEVLVNLSASLKGVSELSRSYDETSEIATVTLRMELEPDVKEIAPEPQPNLEQRKARAETAARIHATALLREKIGQSYVEQKIIIEDMAMTHQEASVHVEGLLEGIHFSEIQWTSESVCQVTASLELESQQAEPSDTDLNLVAEPEEIPAENNLTANE